MYLFSAYALHYFFYVCACVYDLYLMCVCACLFFLLFFFLCNKLEFRWLYLAHKKKEKKKIVIIIQFTLEILLTLLSDVSYVFSHWICYAKSRCLVSLVKFIIISYIHKHLCRKIL